jgi:hypothetical protein
MTVREAIRRLHQDALARGMHELAVAYGWSALRLGVEDIEASLARLRRFKSQ